MNKRTKRTPTTTTPAPTLSAAHSDDTRQAGLWLQTMPAAVLADVAAGRVDLNVIARLELANRGLDRTGTWIGFAAANAQAVDDLNTYVVTDNHGRRVRVTVPE